MHLDLTLLRALNGLAGRWAALDMTGRLLATAGPEIFALLFLALWFALPRQAARVRRAEVYAVAAGVLALSINAVISHFYYRPRPFVADPTLVHLLVRHPADSSFPSDHAAGGFAFWSGMSYAGQRYAWPFLVLAVLIAVARVFVGLHWPSDVLAGAAIGWLAGQLVLRYLQPALRPLADWGMHLLRVAPPEEPGAPRRLGQR